MEGPGVPKMLGGYAVWDPRFPCVWGQPHAIGSGFLGGELLGGSNSNVRSLEDSGIAIYYKKGAR